MPSAIPIRAALPANPRPSLSEKPRRQWARPRGQFCLRFGSARVGLGILLGIVFLSGMSGWQAPTAWGAEGPSSRVAAVPAPRTVDDALRTFEIDPAVALDLFASEPAIVDPVALQFAADGSAYVAEMRDYPHGPKSGETPQSRIVRLIDTDRDGRYETARVFAKDLLFVTGLLPYRDGLIVTHAGEVSFFADRDRDGLAEVRETWFRGFAQENSQLRANHPTWSHDGWVVIANGLRGGQVIVEHPQWRGPKTPLTITGYDFRFDPETGAFATTAGQGQFGMAIDQAGRRYVCSNRNPCQLVMFDDAALARAPGSTVRSVLLDVVAAGEQSRLYPLSTAWTTSNLHAHQFTAACGVTIYQGVGRGGRAAQSASATSAAVTTETLEVSGGVSSVVRGLPTDWSGNVFTCDPTANLVHREVVTAAGAGFAGQSPYVEREFLATDDIWFRPVNLTEGPDGGLYVVDMYRAVIEHPDFMPIELKTRPDLLLGSDRGRIYRVRARTAAPTLLAAARWPADMSTPELLTTLSHPARWFRETALRLLQERRPAGLSPQLEALATGTGPEAGRILALRLLDHREELSTGLLLPLLKAARSPSSPSQRDLTEVVLSLATPRLTSEPELQHALIELVTTGTPRERFLGAIAAAALPSGTASQALLAPVLAATDIDDWTRTAVIMAARDRAAPLLRIVLQQPADSVGHAAIAEDLATLVGQHADRETIRSVWTELAQALTPTLAGPDAKAPAQSGRSDSPAEPLPADLLRGWAVVRGLGTGLQRQGQRLADVLGWNADSQSWRILVTAAAQPRWSHESRRAALRTLPFGPRTAAQETLRAVGLQDPDSAIAVAALEGLARVATTADAEPLLARFAQVAPAPRRAILDILLGDDERMQALLTAVEQQRLQPAEIDTTRQQRLLKHRSPPLRERAAKLLATASADRAAVLAQYEPALSMAGDASRGLQLFSKQCATCHRVGTVGVNVGPDVSDTRDKTTATLLTAILDPNRAVDNNSFGYSVALQDGRVLSGLIAAETPGSVTLRMAEGKTEVLPRNAIEELRSTGQSLMPVGFEKNLSVEQMADLLAYLKHWRYLDGRTPLGSVSGPPR